MIKFITGLPGAGKGVYSVLVIEQELKATDRHIITNFAVRMHPWVRRLGRRRSRGEKGLLAHLYDTYGETFDAEKRVHVIDDEDMYSFYLTRVNSEGKLIKVSGDYERRGENGKEVLIGIDKEEFAATLPCVYLIDEGWKFFFSQNWQKTELGFTFYNAQHRKAGDDLWMTAQHPSQINKQMRLLVQEYHTLVNHGYRKIGVFKQPNVISVCITNESPETRSKSIGALPKVIRFDKQGVGGSFDTAQGAGVQGAGADIERKKSGLPWWGLILLIAGLGYGIIMLAKGGGWVAGHLLTGTLASSKAITNATHVSVVREPIGGLPVNRSSVVSSVVPQKVQIVDVIPLTFDGVCSVPFYVDGKQVGVQVKVLLSDGDIVTLGDGRCSFWRGDIAIVDGVKIKRTTKKESVKYEDKAWISRGHF